MPASDLGHSEWARREERGQQVAAARRARVQAKLGELGCILAHHGVEVAYLFGSMTGDRARTGSDVDMAVVGCPPRNLYRLSSQLRAGAWLDLIDLDRAPADFANEVHRTGQCIFQREPEPK